jgi:uncharacterized membrane protein
MSYEALKFLHILGVVVLVGNVTVTAVWKTFADRTGDAKIVAFAQRMVTITDIGFTLLGIALIYGGGFGAALTGGVSPFGTRWLLWGQGLFALSGLIWIGVLVPIQIRMARQARGFAKGDGIPDTYRSASGRWLWWGIVATVPLVAAIWVMVAKP